MKILYFSQEYPCPGHETMGIFIKDSVDEVSKKIPVEVVSPKAKVLDVPWFPHHEFAKLPDKEEMGRYWVHYPRYTYPIPKKLFYRLSPSFYSSAVTKYVLANIKKPSLIHCHNPYPDGPGVLKIVDHWKVPFVMHLRGSMDYYLDRACMKQLIKSLHKADAIISVNEKQKEYFIRKGVNAHKIHVIPNGVDTELFKPRNKTALRKKLDLPLNKKIILFIGALIPLKDIDTFIAATKTIPDVKIVMLGEGPLRKKIEKELPHALLPGTVSREKTSHYLSAADMLVISSVSEGRPNTMYEALASNLAIVATEVGGIPEVIQNGKNGMLVPPRSPLMLRQAIQELLQNDALRKKIASQGRKTIEKHKLTWGQHAEQLMELYKRVLKNETKH